MLVLPCPKTNAKTTWHHAVHAKRDMECLALDSEVNIVLCVSIVGLYYIS
jgi:hypothetical protein